MFASMHRAHVHPRPGSLVALDQGSAHDVEALEETFLLTIAWRGRPADQIGNVQPADGCAIQRVCNTEQR